MENFEIGGLETPNEEEIVIAGPSGTPVELLVRRALRNYVKNPESNIKYYVQIGDVKMLVEKNDSEEDAKKRYATLLKRE